MNGILICLTGIDGSGKSSHAESICKRLESQGLRIDYVYGRHAPRRLTKIIFQIGRFLGNRPRATITNSSHRQSQTSMKGIPFATVVTSAAILVDYVPSIGSDIRRKVRRGESVLLDRYIFDTVVSDIAAVFEAHRGALLRILKLFQAFAPMPNLVVLMDIPVEISLGRKSDTANPSYLNYCRSSYLYLADRFHWVVLDSRDEFGKTDDRLLMICREALDQNKEG